MNLDDLLSAPEPLKKQEKDPLFGVNTLQISNYAYEKAYTYAKLACDIHGDSIECGGYLIKPKDSKERIAEDAFLARDQDVQAGLFTINAESVIKAGRELDKNGYQVLGWWHSHGYLKTFFSQLDDNGQMTCLNEIAAFNYVTQQNNYELGNLETKVDGNKLVLWDKKSPGKKYEIEFSGKNKLAIARMAVSDEKRIGFSYGLVVNANYGKKKQPYSEIAVRDLCNNCRRAKDVSLEVEVEVFEDLEKMEIDEKKLKKEIKDRVKMPRKFFGGFFSKGGSWFGAGPVYSGGKQVGYRDSKGNYTGCRPKSDSIDDIEGIKEVRAEVFRTETPEEIAARIKLYCDKNPKAYKGDMDVKDNGTWLSYKPAGSNNSWKYLCSKRDLPELPKKETDILLKTPEVEETPKVPSADMQDYIDSLFGCQRGPEVLTDQVPYKTPIDIPGANTPGIIKPEALPTQKTELILPESVTAEKPQENNSSQDSEVNELVELCNRNGIRPVDIEHITNIGGKLCFKMYGSDVWTEFG